MSSETPALASSGHHGALAVDDAAGVQAYFSFDDMSLDESVLRGIYTFGLERPFAVQQRAIVPMLRGRDVVVQAPAGSGKTCALSIGTVQRLDWGRKTLQAVILTLTHELAANACTILNTIGRDLAGPGFDFAQTFAGGTPIEDDLHRLKGGGVMVCVGTPGRVLDLMRRGALSAEKLRLLILDEADEMAPQSFQEQLAEIFRRLPESVQVAVFSTAKADDVLAVAERVMHSPTRIVIERDELALGRTKHFYVAVENSDKIETLCDIYESVSICQSIIFVNSRAMVESVGAQLSAYGHVASSLHGDMAMDDRRRVVADFLAGRSRVVVTTDLMARGLDSMSQFIGCVVNFELPAKTNDYLRRSCGRDSSPRYGRKAVVISFVSQRDMSRLREIESHLSITIDGLPMNLAHVLSDW